MKSTGVIRKLDELGRFVIPAEIRKVFDMNCKDSVALYTEDDLIILKKFEKGCIFCGSLDDLKTFRDKNICTKCTKSIKSFI